MPQAHLIRMFLRRHTRLTAIVSIGAAMVFFFLTIIFPKMGLDKASLIAEGWPPLIKDLFGDPLLGFTDVYAWLFLEIFHIGFWVVFGVLAAILAARIVAKEIEDRSMDILLSCPVTRTGMLASRLLATLLLLLLAVVPSIVAFALGILYLGEPLHTARLVLTCFEGALLSFSMGTLALLISVALPNQILSISFASACFAALFFVDTLLVKLVPALDRVSFLNPFHFYRAGAVLIRGELSFLDPLALAAASLVLAIASMLAFSRKDVPC